MPDPDLGRSVLDVDEAIFPGDNTIRFVGEGVTLAAPETELQWSVEYREPLITISDPHTLDFGDRIKSLSLSGDTLTVTERDGETLMVTLPVRGGEWIEIAEPGICLDAFDLGVVVIVLGVAMMAAGLFGIMRRDARR